MALRGCNHISQVHVELSSQQATPATCFGTLHALDREDSSHIISSKQGKLMMNSTLHERYAMQRAQTRVLPAAGSGLSPAFPTGGLESFELKCELIPPSGFEN